MQLIKWISRLLSANFTFTHVRLVTVFAALRTTCYTYLLPLSGVATDIDDCDLHSCILRVFVLADQTPEWFGFILFRIFNEFVNKCSSTNVMTPDFQHFQILSLSAC